MASGLLPTLSRALAPRHTKATLSPVAENRGGWYRVFESFLGAWQNNDVLDHNTILSYGPVFACQTLIASDIAKLRVKLVRRDANGIWSEVEDPAYSPVLQRPNPSQTRIQFIENWILSKLQRGNTYALKRRDERGNVNRFYILDPNRVQPMVSEDGSVFYQLQADNVAGLTEPLLVPAREVVHDRFNVLFHPLVGVSPLFACAVSATQGLNIQNSSAFLFKNRAQPGGIITAPGAISDETAVRVKEYWDVNFAGANAGRVAVLGDNLQFTPIAMTSVDAQLVEQLRLSAEQVATVFHVPGYKIGVGSMPANSNVQALNVEYFSQCLQTLIEALEECLDEGLGIGWTQGLGTELDIDNLLRMDSATLFKTIADGVRGGFLAPNEGRRKLDLKPVAGGDSPYLQHQDYSLAALSKRDAGEDPFGTAKASSAAKTITTRKDANGNLVAHVAEGGAALPAELASKDIAALVERVRQLEERPIPKYSGIWKDDADYPEGALVTSDGSLWSALAPSRSHKPGGAPIAGLKLWQMVAKRGGRK